jgi:hypothetical protein
MMTSNQCIVSYGGRDDASNTGPMCGMEYHTIRISIFVSVLLSVIPTKGEVRGRLALRSCIDGIVGRTTSQGSETGIVPKME